MLTRLTMTAPNVFGQAVERITVHIYKETEAQVKAQVEGWWIESQIWNPVSSQVYTQIWQPLRHFSRELLDVEESL